MPRQHFRQQYRISGRFATEAQYEANQRAELKFLHSPIAPEPHSVSPEDYWDYYDPAATINPERPRTLRWRYNKNEWRAEVVFREGATYTYFDVHPNTWRGLKRTESPGRFINRILNNHPYRPGGWGSDIGPDE